MDERTSEEASLETERVEIRALTPDDLDWVVRIDREHTGRSRAAYYRVRLDEALNDTGVRISRGAWVQGEPAGFLLGRLYYGEFGIPEPTAILDSLGVARTYARRGVGLALVSHLRAHLRALGIEKVHTQVEWEQTDLLEFFLRSGFRPAPRLCLQLQVSEPDPVPDRG